MSDMTLQEWVSHNAITYEQEQFVRHELWQRGVSSAGVTWDEYQGHDGSRIVWDQDDFDDALAGFQPEGGRDGE
jgi:hypothetical protein